MAEAPGAISMWISRPRLGAAILLGLAAGLAAWRLAPALGLSVWLIAGWDMLCVSFLAAVGLNVWREAPDQIRARAAREDEGRGLILFLTLAASAVSLAAVAAELSAAKSQAGLSRALHVGGAFGTVALSWAMVQAIFALHYAHEYYTARPNGGDAGGLAFPGDPAPDYWDFLHFSVIIGVASQTADVAFTGKALRRLGTLHSLVAFGFNTLVVALTINLLAGLF
jgi:uncharacterized membrane protein